MGGLDLTLGFIQAAPLHVAGLYTHRMNESTHHSCSRVGELGRQCKAGGESGAGPRNPLLLPTSIWAWTMMSGEGEAD